MTIPFIIVVVPAFIFWVYITVRVGDKYGFWGYMGMMFIGAPVLFISVIIILNLLGINVETFSNGECVEWTWWGECKRVMP